MASSWMTGVFGRKHFGRRGESREGVLAATDESNEVDSSTSESSGSCGGHDSDDSEGSCGGSGGAHVSDESDDEPERRAKEKEEKWAAERDSRVISLGSRVILLMNFCQVVWLVAGLVLDRFDCAIYPFLASGAGVRTAVLLSGFWLSTFGFLFCFCHFWRRPLFRPAGGWSRTRTSLANGAERVVSDVQCKWIYISSLCLWFGVVMVAFIALADDINSYQFHCGGVMLFDEDAWLGNADDDTIPKVPAKGYNILQVNGLLVLFSPYWIPDARWLLPLLWVWILIFYSYAAYTAGAIMNWNLFVAVAFLLVTSCAARRGRQLTEETMRTQYNDRERAIELKETYLKILKLTLPDFVIKDVLMGGVVADPLDKVSILFIMLDECEDSGRDPDELLGFLNQQFTKFDRICAKHDVTKIETVGAEYVCAVGVSPKDRASNDELGHHVCLRRLIEVAREVLDLQYKKGQAVVRMGMHTGPVIGGIVGKKLPRFRLFGDTINTTARMMQKGLPGELQFGHETRINLPRDVAVTNRGEIEMKGKGRVQTYLLRHKNSQLLQPNLERRATSGSQRRRNGRFHTQTSTSMIAAMASVNSTQCLCGAARECVNATCAMNMGERSTAPSSSRASRLSEEEEELMQQITMGSETSRCWARKFREKRDENEFQAWFHKNFRLRNTPHFLTRWLMLSVCVTAAEMLYLWMWSYRILAFKDFFNRVSKYLLIRLIVFLIVLAGYFWLNSDGLRKHRFRFYIVYLSGTLVCLALGFLSYDSLDLEQIPRTLPACPEHDLVCGVANYGEYLAFLPVFVVAMCESGCMFEGSFAFPGIAVAILVFEFLHSHYDPVFHTPIFICTFIVRTFTFIFEAYVKERVVREIFLCQHQNRLAEQKIRGILETMMPPAVLKDMTEHRAAQHPYKNATIAQSDLCGFTELASTRTPQEVVEFISELFGKFDELTDKYGVYKVETIGDAYIAGQADQPLTLVNKPLDVVLFALEMVEVTLAWSRGRGETVSCRVGVHSGECVGGVVGNDMQRYHLFGELMTTLEVLESTAPRSRVHVSKACREAIHRYVRAESVRCEVTFQERHEPTLCTSKGEVHNFDEVGGRTYLVNACSGA